MTPVPTVWLTGLPAAGKTTLARAANDSLRSEGIPSYVADGDDLRTGLTSDLGFSRADRAESVRRAGEVAAVLARAGVVPLVSLVSPYRLDRDRVRARHRQLGIGFIEVHVATPAELCESRDPKGLYARARRGELVGLTGVGDPYEAPESPDVVVGLATVEEDVTAVLQAFRLWCDSQAGHSG